VLANAVKTHLFRPCAALKQTFFRPLNAVLSRAFPFDGGRCDRRSTRVLGHLDFKHPAGPLPG
jgi:hypothetical protein